MICVTGRDGAPVCGRRALNGIRANGYQAPDGSSVKRKGK